MVVTQCLPIADGLPLMIILSGMILRVGLVHYCFDGLAGGYDWLESYTEARVLFYF